MKNLVVKVEYGVLAVMENNDANLRNPNLFSGYTLVKMLKKSGDTVMIDIETDGLHRYRFYCENRKVAVEVLKKIREDIKNPVKYLANNIGNVDKPYYEVIDTDKAKIGIFISTHIEDFDLYKGRFYHMKSFNQKVAEENEKAELIKKIVELQEQMEEDLTECKKSIQHMEEMFAEMNKKEESKEESKEEIQVTLVSAIANKANEILNLFGITDTVLNGVNEDLLLAEYNATVNGGNAGIDGEIIFSEEYQDI